MAGTRSHSCTYFDDGELVCGCGQRAVHVLDEDINELVLVALEDEGTSIDASRLADVRIEELAVSA